MLYQAAYIDEQPREHSYVYFFLLFITSIAIADPASQLDLPDEFNNVSVDTIFERGNEWRKQEEEENEWRNTEEETSRKEVRWGAKNIYEDDFDPFDSSTKELDTRRSNRTPEPQRQFQLRF